MDINEIIRKSKDVSKWNNARKNAGFITIKPEENEYHLSSPNNTRPTWFNPLMPCYDDFCKAYFLGDYPEIILPEEDIEKCKAFAEDMKNMGHQNLWETRKNGARISSDKVHDDNVAGKKGEWIAYHTFKYLLDGNSQISDISKPDMNIYPVSQKSFDEDMKAVGEKTTRISVKTFRCRVGKPSKTSWVIAKSDGFEKKSGCDSHFFSSDNSERTDYLAAFVALDPSGKGGRIISMIPMQSLYDHRDEIYDHLEIRSFSETKRAIYADKIYETIPEEMIRFSRLNEFII